MAHCFIMDFEGGTAAQYDAIMEDMALGGRLPAHALIHGAGLFDGHIWRVVDVWENPEAFQRFAAERITPAAAKQGVGQPAITGFPVHEIRRGDPDQVTFQHLVRLPVDAAGFAALDAKIGAEPAAGLVFHANGPLDGGWATVGFWTTKEARDRFVAERIAPAMAGAGAPPAIEDLVLHNAMTEAAVTTA